MTWTTVATGICFGDGARWHEDRLWLSDMHAGVVLRVDPSEGLVEPVCEVPGAPSGLGWLPDGRLLVVSMQDRRVLRLDADGALRLHADLSAVATFHCNDMVVASDGTAYVGNFGSDFVPGEKRRPADLASVSPDRTVSVAARGLGFPNGAVITPDGCTLILAETMGRRLVSFAIGAGGRLGEPTTWADLGRGLPDGITLDAEGAVWYADPRAKACVRVAQGGTVLDTVPTGDSCYSCVLGGRDGKTLFALTSGTDDPHAARLERSARILAQSVATPAATMTTAA